MHSTVSRQPLRTAVANPGTAGNKNTRDIRITVPTYLSMNLPTYLPTSLIPLLSSSKPCPCPSSFPLQVRHIASPCACCWRPGGCPDTYPVATAGPALGQTSSSTSTSNESSYNSSAAAQYHSAADGQGAEPATVGGAPPAASFSRSVTQPPGQQEQAGSKYDSPYAPSAGPGSSGGSSRRGFSAANAEYETTYYGMVVQGVPAPSPIARSFATTAAASASAAASGGGLESRDGSEAGTAAAMAAVGGTAADLRQGSDGCFVLKLSRAPGADAGGACTHYTVTRVCQGQPLHDQLCGSWLTNAQKGA